MSVLEELDKELSEFEVLQKKLGPVINFEGQNDPQHYFYLLKPLAQNPHTKDNEILWRKLAWMVRKGTKPTSAKNTQGQNPLEEFYELNKKRTREFKDPEIHYAHNFMNPENSYLRQVIELRNLFEKVLTQEELKPLEKTLSLWQNFIIKTQKQEETDRVAWIRFLKVAHEQPSKAPSKTQVKNQLMQKVAAEKAVCQKINEHNKSFWREEDKMYRPHSPFRGIKIGWKEQLYYQPLPKDPQEAFKEYLLTIQDVDEYALTPNYVKKKLALYNRFCNPTKQEQLRINRRQQNER